MEEKTKEIKINGKAVGKGNPCLIIAEAGSNYNGDLTIAKKLVDVAVEANADIVKFQTFLADKLVTKDAPKAEYQKKDSEDSETYYNLLKGLELEEKEWIELKDYCKEKGIIFMSTPHSGKWSVDLLEKLEVPAYKIGSGDLTNLPFLDYVAKKNKPILLSTGMAILNEVEEAVNTIKKTGNDQIILLHCTTEYPCKFEDVNLRVMDALKEKFNEIVGYSDHTLGLEVPIAAVARGAKVIEKHFTIDKNLPGPDHKASLDPQELKDMVKSVRDVEKILGNAEKKPTEKELEIMKIARKSIVAAKDIVKGEKISEEMLEIKRPGTGIHPKMIDEIIGSKATQDIKKDSLVKKEWFE